MNIELTEEEAKIVAKDLTETANKLITNATPLERDLGLLYQAIQPRDAILKKLEKATKEQPTPPIENKPLPPPKPPKRADDIPFVESE